MAVSGDSKPRRPRSTGAVPTPTEPVTSTQTADSTTSTGAAEFSSEPVEHVVTNFDDTTTVVCPTPTEPFTMSIGWLPQDLDVDPVVETKVIEAPAGPTVQASGVQVETK